MKPLSIITHIKSNIKRLIPTIMTLGMEFAALTFMISIGIGEMYSMKYNMGAFVEKSIIVEIEPTLDSARVNELKSSIKKVQGVSNVIEANIATSNAMLPLMYCGIPFIKTDVQEMEKLLDEYKLKLIDGEYPKNDNEIILTKDAVNALNVKIDDFVGPDYNSAYSFDNNYKVVGIVEGEYPIYLSKFNKEKHKKQMIVQVEAGKARVVLENIKKIDKDFLDAYDYREGEKFVTNVSDMLVRLGTLAIGIFSLVILITVTNLSKSLIGSFSEEYSLLKAIGYKMKFIKGRISMQLAALLCGATIVGILGGVIVNVIFDKLYCVPRGIAYQQFSIYLVVIPVIVAVVLYILTSFTIGKKVNKMDFMSDLEI